MWYSVDFRSVFLIVAIINTVENRRYDIEQQCKTEYGTDLTGVLRQFRRSDDYVTILKMRTKEFDVFFLDILYQSYEWSLNKLDEKVMADFGLDVTTPVTEVTTTTIAATESKVKLTDCNTTDHKLRMLKSRFNLRRAGAPVKAARAYRETIANVRRIDRHPMLNQHLTVAQRNHYKSLGFEFVGELIHTVILAFGGSLDPVENKGSGGSTLMAGGKPTIPTTKHMLRHTVEPITERNSKKTNIARTARTAPSKRL